MVTREGSRPASAEQRLKELGIELPAPPEPFGTYAEAVQTGNLHFLTGMLPTEGRAAKFIGRVGAELDVETGRKAAYLAALTGSACRWPLQEMPANSRKSLTALRSCCKVSFGNDKNPSRLVYGVASLPLGTPVELEFIFEVSV
jgi:enamine deaminase RidA (YjgF/YER057c/UK114 family)